MIKSTFMWYLGLFKCKGESNCISHREVCDGTVNCLKHREDEKYCHKQGKCTTELIYVKCSELNTYNY